MKIGLALGSNLGDRRQHLRRAKEFLVGLSVAGRHLASPVYETEPVGCPAGSAKFLNAVIEIEYPGTTRELFERVRAYEWAAGRQRSARNAPRAIDIDLLYGAEVNDPDLVVPHPRLTQRRFVLQPLAAIRPELVIAGRTVRQWLAALPAEAGEVTVLP